MSVQLPKTIVETLIISSVYKIFDDLWELYYILEKFKRQAVNIFVENNFKLEIPLTFAAAIR
jgi:hypothetical protein